MFEESMLAKLGKLQEKNIAAYPPRTPKATHLSTQIKASFETLEGKMSPLLAEQLQSEVTARLSSWSSPMMQAQSRHTAE